MFSPGSAPAVIADAPGLPVLMRRLTASLAHNVNNALTGVIGYLELALRSPNESDGCVRSGLDCAHEAADAVRRIVGCARRIAEAAPAEPLSLRQLALEAAERLSQEAPSVRISLAGASVGTVLVSADLAALALDGLLDAVASLGSGVLTLRLGDEDGRGVLYVEGGGIAAEEWPRRLLEPSLLIEIQGGAVEVLSGPGRPVVVRLSLPRRSAAPIRHDEPQVSPSAPHLPTALGLLRQAV
jgi:signal transduction histidine kinase